MPAGAMLAASETEADENTAARSRGGARSDDALGAEVGRRAPSLGLAADWRSSRTIHGHAEKCT
eukprot:2923076-Pyramimonas_sp.AAC.1